MKILKDKDSIIKLIRKKSESLQKIASGCTSKVVDTEEKFYSWELRKNSGQVYLNELEDLEKWMKDVPYEIMLVPKPTFEKQLNKADFSQMEIDGVYVKAATVLNYPFDEVCLVYTAPLNSL